MRIVHFVVISVVTAAPALAADKHGHTERGHQHGVAQLQVALEGQELRIGLDGPAENVLGFEHAPKTDAQKKTVQRVEQQLKQPAQLFELPAAARCEAQPAQVEIKLPAPGSKEKHSDVEAEWRWKCAAPAELRQVNVGLFKAFSKLKELHVQSVTSAGQKSAKLAPRATQLTLAP